MLFQCLIIVVTPLAFQMPLGLEETQPWGSEPSWLNPGSAGGPELGSLSRMRALKRAQPRASQHSIWETDNGPESASGRRGGRGRGGFCLFPTFQNELLQLFWIASLKEPGWLEMLETPHVGGLSWGRTIHSRREPPLMPVTGAGVNPPILTPECPSSSRTSHGHSGLCKQRD